MHYLAPELVGDNAPTEATDMWSCGIICYMLLAGDLPFNGRSEDQLRESIQTEQVDFTGMGLIKRVE